MNSNRKLWWAGVAFGFLLVPVVYAGVVIFADDFESGDTSTWSHASSPTTDALALNCSEFGLPAESLSDRSVVPYCRDDFAPHFAPIHLPTGSSIGKIELEAADNSASASLTLEMVRCPVGNWDNCDSLALLETGLADVGSGPFTTTPEPPLEVDNSSYEYFVYLDTWVVGGITSSSLVRSVRLEYNR